MAEDPRRRWAAPAPGKLVGKGHPAGDFLEAYDWDVLAREPSFLKLEAHLPDQVKNPLGQLFGGFTPTYVDLIAIFTVHTNVDPSREWRWLATTNMRVDYFEPITGPRFVVESQVEKQRNRMHFVSTRFFQDGVLAVYALTTMREANRPIGDA